MIYNFLMSILKRSFLIYLLLMNLVYANTDFEGRVIDTGDDLTKVIRINANLILFGEKANLENANLIRNTILNYWAKRSNDKPWMYFDYVKNQVYEVQFMDNVYFFSNSKMVSALMIPGYDSPYTLDNYINLTNVPKEDARAFVQNWDTGVWSSNEDEWTYAHEFGHLLGLIDRYSDSNQNGKVFSIPHQGWDGNIMASFGGRVEQRNIDSLVRNILTKKSANKINDQLIYSIQGVLE